ncbi:hypothetical protein [Actinacidiphila glaucinigra]|uniref:hypothetical protein n=1 Tax=Actinacidiphila glaucinigra TaxID=235986 RepID=UPI0033A74F92
MAPWQPATTTPEGRALVDLLTRIRGIHGRCGELPGSDVVGEIEQWADWWNLPVTNQPALDPDPRSPH